MTIQQLLMAFGRLYEGVRVAFDRDIFREIPSGVRMAFGSQQAHHTIESAEASFGAWPECDSFSFMQYPSGIL